MALCLLVPSHYLKQSRLIVNWTYASKLQWNPNWNSGFFFNWRCISKCHVQNDGHLVSASMCQGNDFLSSETRILCGLSKKTHSKYIWYEGSCLANLSPSWGRIQRLTPCPVAGNESPWLKPAGILLHWTTKGGTQRTGPCLNIKTILPRYGDSHVKDKTVGETVLSLTWESLYW